MTEDDLTGLWARLGAVERRVRKTVADRQSQDPNLTDPYRGLYITDEAVRALLDSPEPLVVPADIPPTAEGRLAESFGLTALDMEFLLIALAPDLDARFERLYGYLNDDVTRRRPTVGLALALCGQTPAGPGRFRFRPDAPLVTGGLVDVLGEDQPFLSREVRVPDRVQAHLLGLDRVDPGIAGFTRVRTRVDGLRPVGAMYSRGEVEVAGTAVVADLSMVSAPSEVVAPLVREARLRGASLVVGPVDGVPPTVLRALLAHDLPLVLHGKSQWDPRWAPVTPLPVDAGTGPAWAEALDGLDVPVAELSAFRLGASQMRAAVSVARRLAARENRAVTAADVRAGVRTQNGAGLAKLARRITPAVTWSDLVLPDRAKTRLAELAARARHRDTVLGDWRMRPGGGRGRGVLALFAGESGTGKTLAAEVVAGDLGMDLYVVDLSSVVDKYVGETEKNLERVFDEAADVNGVLLFDEADALFGKRSAVSDSRDRYANLESAYLLQRMESFDGIAILTTNLRANLDEAFTRRLDVIAAFPMPDAAQRRLLWDTCLGPAIPRADDLDLDVCASRFDLAGGAIRSCAVSAAYLAAAGNRAVTMADLMTAIHEEHHKQGHLTRAEDFRPWLAVTPA
ncbi:ATP-binding protein [Actinokineospora auranticolor]|uniref:ATPase family protein associated with various cellular activities (AAA) n=1 Tax=Actinokineospora auranticolor TaxID=155976 RepID=A0A2S6GTD0_9PSEU|nr:ATP-binding protein [Actinokineospora auranticolor]PPK68470.1 ATPase family protein associated with various cellular activities (AAA) [Actinokineospora auranticolor]